MAGPVIENTTPRRVVSGDVARQGEAPGHVRWVLRISLALCVIAGVALYLVYAH